MSPRLNSSENFGAGTENLSLEPREAIVNADDVVRVRYAPGVVGETRRVVHVAKRRPDGACAALCDLVIAAAEAEFLDELAGMPCLVCVRALALGSGGATAELDAEAPR